MIQALFYIMGHSIDQNPIPALLELIPSWRDKQ